MVEDDGEDQGTSGESKESTISSHAQKSGDAETYKVIRPSSRPLNPRFLRPPLVAIICTRPSRWFWDSVISPKRY